MTEALEMLDAHGATWRLDGVGPIPAPLAAAVCQWGHPLRLALFGRCLHAGAHDFGPPLGARTVLVCEKWAGVWLPEAPLVWQVQGVALGLLAGLARPPA